MFECALARFACYLLAFVFIPSVSLLSVVQFFTHILIVFVLHGLYITVLIMLPCAVSVRATHPSAMLDRRSEESGRYRVKRQYNRLRTKFASIMNRVDEHHFRAAVFGCCVIVCGATLMALAYWWLAIRIPVVVSGDSGEALRSSYLSPHARERRLADSYNAEPFARFRVLNALVGVNSASDTEPPQSASVGVDTPPPPPPPPLHRFEPPIAKRLDIAMSDLAQIHSAFARTALANPIESPASNSLSGGGGGGVARTLYVVPQPGATNEQSRFFYSPYFRCFVDAHAFRIERVTSLQQILLSFDAERKAIAALAATATDPDAKSRAERDLVLARSPYVNILLMVEYAPASVPVLEQLRTAAKSISRTLSIGVYHTGDEMYAQPKNELYDASDYIIRLYFDQALMNRYGRSKLVWIPNGWSVREFFPANWDGKSVPAAPAGRDDCSDTYADPVSIKLASDRKYVFNLLAKVGHAARSRSLEPILVPSLDALHQTSRITTESGGMPHVIETEGLNHTAYQSILHDSVFTFIPCGNNPETFRVWEALQSDSIPIIERCPHAPIAPPDRHYLNPLLKNDDCPAPPSGAQPTDEPLAHLHFTGVIPCPLLVVADWHSVLPVVEAYLPSLKLKRSAPVSVSPAAEAINPLHDIDLLQRRTALWWEQYKLCIRRRVTDSILTRLVEPPTRS